MNDNPDNPSVPAETAPELFRALKQLHAEGRVALSYDFARLHHMDCPVAVEADGNILAYAVIAVALLALWLKGWIAAGAVVVIGMLLYFSLGRRFLRGRIRRRIEEQALASFELWQKLWRFGGIGLVPRENGNACRAPEGNWMGLVRSLRGADGVGA
jgi:hypothetical protein